MATTTERAVLANGCEMLVEYDVEIPTSDGSFLSANVFRPAEGGPLPVILTVGTHPKDKHFWEGQPRQFFRMVTRHPEVQHSSSCRYIHFETVDPERWIPRGYAVVRVDSRGTGKSPGFMDPGSIRAGQDSYEAVEWAGTRPWTSGKVGMLGISIFAMTQWAVASLHPPHLAAIIPWEGAADQYRDVHRHGGILCTLMSARRRLIMERAKQEGVLRPGASTAGETPQPRRAWDLASETKNRPLFDEWYREHSPALEKITVPLLSSGNWGGLGMHLRGDIEGYTRASSKQKWLELHTGEHWEEFYLDRALDKQMRFFDHFLKGADNGWDLEPAVHLAIRRPDGETYRKESAWPLPRTRWTKLYLDVRAGSLLRENPAREAAVSYAALSDGITFLTHSFKEETEITGPVVLRLWVSSSTDDMDVFATLRAFNSKGEEITFMGSHEPKAPVSQGWLRVSHRKLDPVLSTPYRPYHSHDTVEKLVPGRAYAIDVEIWATSVVLPPGYRLGLTIQGKDFERPEAEAAISYMGGRPTRGSANFLHEDPDDRNPETFGGKNTIISGGDRQSYLLVPVIPSE